MAPAKAQQGFSFAKMFFSIFKLFLITAVILVFIIVPLVYLHGSEHPHEIDEHPLYQIFEEQTYANIIKQLNKKASNRVFITGDFDAGLEHFLTHYANKLTEQGKQVIIKEVVSEQIPITPYVKQAKFFIEQHIDFEPNVPTVWILLSADSFPHQQVSQLLARFPRDRFIVASQVSDHSEEPFKTFNFPSIDEEQFKSQLIQGVKLDPNQVDVIFGHFSSIRQIFNVLDDNVDALSHNNLLGQNFKSMELLTLADKQILADLCTNGLGKAAKPTKTLDAFGCIFFHNNYYWNSDLARLNYELQQNAKCPTNGVMPSELRQKMQQQLRQKQLQKQRKQQEEQERLRQKQENAKKKKPKNKQPKAQQSTQKAKKTNPNKKKDSEL